MTHPLEVADQPWLARTRSLFERARDRIDAMLLRLHGRVDTPGYDRGLPYMFALLQATVLIALALARHHGLILGEETAKFAQATWQIAEGVKPVTTLAGGNVIAEQGSLILYPLAIVTALFPRTETLMVAKSLALAVTMLPLWRLARRHGQLGIGATSLVVFAYGIYSAVHAMNAADFAPAILAVPALMWAVLFGFDERPRLMVAAIVFALCCRADLGLTVAGLGVLLLLGEEQRGESQSRSSVRNAQSRLPEVKRRLREGRIAATIGLVWVLVAIFLVQPWLDGGDHTFLAPYAEFGDSPLGVLWGIISNPVTFLRSVGSLANFQVLVLLFAPVLFLPLTAPRYLMPAVPLYVLYMGAAVEPGRLREAAQTVPITVFVFVATIFALKQAGRTLVKRVRVERRIILALLLTSIIFFVRDSPSSPYFKPWDWGPRSAVDIARLDAVDELPSLDAPVRASSTVLPLLSERLGVYALDTETGETLSDIVVAAVADVDWIILDRDAEALLPADIDLFRVRLIERGWEVESRDNDAGIEVYRFTGVVTPEQLEILQASTDGG